MVVVAACATVLFGLKTWQWSRAAEEFRDQAASYSWNALTCDRDARRYRDRAESWQRAEDEQRREAGGRLPSPSYHHVLVARSEADRLTRLAAHYTLLQGKYERAARRPWLPVPPDPPAPK